MAKEKEEMTFEEKIKLLEEIVKELETGEVPLDEAINKYTEAMMLENGKLDDFTVSE